MKIQNMKNTILYPIIALGLMVCGAECSAQTVSGKVKGHAYVDLGLKSGVKWATCNIGAKKPTEYGDYFAWGETKEKKDFSWKNYKWCDNKKVDSNKYPQDFTKYCVEDKHGKVDDVKTLDSKDDAATAQWGGSWRTPTNDELGELLDICNWKWTNNFNGSGVAGQIGTSKRNGNKIFFPVAGYQFESDDSTIGKSGYYWSSTLYDRYSPCAYYIEFGEGGIEWDYYTFRSRGLSIRAVTK